MNSDLLGTATARRLARGGALTGLLSVIAIVVGSAVHGGLPDTVTEAGVRSYIASANAAQNGIGNFIELLGNVLLLVFATFLYGTVRAADTARRSWPALAALLGAAILVAVTAVGIAAQQAVVEWGKAGADAKATLGLYIFDNDSFSLSFGFGALFLGGIGVALMGGRGPLRLLALSAPLIAIVLLICGLIGAASPGQGLVAIAYLLFLLWIGVAGVYFVVRPSAS